MIKTIKKIDLNGNEIWQEVCVCNRCKKTLEPTDFVNETKWTAWHPVKMEPGVAYGFGQGSNPVKHICECCKQQVEAFLNGEDIQKERQALSKLSTDNLKKIRNSFMCGTYLADEIDEILKSRDRLGTHDVFQSIPLRKP